MTEPPKRPDTKVSVVTSAKEGKESDHDVSYQVPRVAISEHKDAVILELEMPGVGPNGVEMSVEKDRLTIIGSREEETNNLDPVYRNRNPLDYRRVFSLGRGVDLEKISASLDNDGMLMVTLPKTSSEIGKTIAVRIS